MNLQPIINSRKSLPLMIVVAVISVACGGGGGGGTPPTTLALSKVGADPASDTVGDVLPTLTVQLKDNGLAKAGTNVVWTTPSGGVVTTPSVTDVNGMATATWTLGPTAGAQTAVATVTNAAGSPVLFNVNALPDAASRVVPSTAPNGNGQSKPITRVLASLRVQVADQFGNPVLLAGQQVDWTVPGGAAFGTVNPTSSLSDATGLATTTPTLGTTVGPVTVSANVAGFSGPDAVFNETARALPPSALSVTVGPGVRFTSVRNGTFNPAVDTLAVNGTVTWNLATGSIPHSVRSTGSPSFPSSFGSNPPTTPMGASYQAQFNTVGTYQYDCGIHGPSMSGRIVVE